MVDKVSSPDDSTTAPTPAIEGSAYDLIRARLEAQAKTLGGLAETLNARRIEVFGGTEMGVLGNERVRTENNCIPRDIVTIGKFLLFGYNVFIGLKKETTVADVLSLHTFATEGESSFAFEPVPVDDPANFLSDPRFQKEFTELVTYYKDARLAQLRTTKGKLLAVFQVGERASDVKVFRWALDAEGGATYLDNRGVEDHVFPPSHDFEWTLTGREHFVLGRHPHVNILDEVFVETVGGDLTVKVEDNTEDGKGIYSEVVTDRNQALADGQISFAKLGVLILLKILPYREEQHRYLVFNTRTKDVRRIDGIGQACVQLPEDHGIIFPGGYYLQSGESKTFDLDTTGLRFLRQVRSPNGEDVLYQFYEEATGRMVLFPYNLIRKEVATPILGHGTSIFPDGKMVVFRAEDEPTRVHHMQVWRTAFMSDEEAAKESAQSAHAGSFLVKVGNPDLVRGISDAQSIRRAIGNQVPSMAVYEDLIAFTTKVLDTYHWLSHADVGNLAKTLHEVRSTAELVIDEFEKLLAIQAAAKAALEAAEHEQEQVLLEIRPETWETVDQFVDAMARLRSQRGRLITLKEMRSADVGRIQALEDEVAEKFDYLSERATAFLTDDDAMNPYRARSAAIEERIEAMTQAMEAEDIGSDIDQMATGLDLLTEVVSGLKIDDASARTRILEEISGVFGLVNRARAGLVGRRKALLEKEGVAEFGAQFKLLTQSVQSALGLCDTPEKCDEQLTRLMVSLEELEGKFGEFDQFLGDLAQKRDEIYETFSGRKQQLLEERQRRAQNLATAADRILTGVARRAQSFKEVSDLNAYFASDAMVMKARDIAVNLLAVGDTVRADEIQSRIKKAREDAIRQLRDKNELFDEEGGDQVVKFGQHRFTVNTQSLDLTLLPRDDGLALHLTGTDYFESLTDSEQWGAPLRDLSNFWNRSLISESKETYRAEYLAASILFAAEREEHGLSLERLRRELLGKGAIAANDDTPVLLEFVREIASQRYDEGYDRGVHDHDAALILEKLLALYSTAGLLRFSPRARALGVLFWAHHANDDVHVVRCASWARRARSFGRLRTALGHTPALSVLATEMSESISAFAAANDLEPTDDDVRQAGAYLAEEIMTDPVRITTSVEATRLVELFHEELDALATRAEFDADVRELSTDLKSQAAVVRAWIDTFLDRAARGAGTAADVVAALRPVASEAVAHILAGNAVTREVSSALSSIEISGLLGNHGRIRDRAMTVRLDEFLERLRRFEAEDVVRFRAFRDLRHRILEDAKARMRLEEFKPRVLSSFVRNKLINDVYLPLVGDNLAKQIGGVGAKKRTDLMGLLLLISPPGYGKTTLMEYIASRLGLVFMKVNGPSLGHDVHSLDPAEAPNATARQEVEKINLAFEMGNNVMLYLDDIQHTHPELLQKFISLCDGSRRIEGVWKGNTRTYDLRGKKFCVVMAGNPYTESGDKFQIPDMLSNRADTYNLGDILGGREDAFALSYVENALTSNAVLQPLATREQKDVYQLVRMAKGEDLPLTDLAHGYSSVEVEEILNVLRRLLTCQDVLLKVNAEYIRSASMDDRYRTEPRFQLQGSYRNMSKLAEKIVAVMNDVELERVISDHYQQEAQTLTTGAEQNLLKLRELRGVMTDDERARWQDVKKTFARNQMSGGSDDPVTKATATLAGLSQHLEGIREVFETQAQTSAGDRAKLHAALGNLSSLNDLAALVKEVGGVRGALVEDIVPTVAELSTPLVAALTAGNERTTRAVLQGAKAVAESQTSSTAALGQAQHAAAQAHADQMNALLGNLPIDINVNVPTGPFVATLAQQQKLVEGTLLPVLQAALGAQAAANAANASSLEGALKTAEVAKAAAEHAATSASANAAAMAAAETARVAATRGARAVAVEDDAGVRSAQIEMEAVPTQVAESLVLLRELFDRMEKGQVSAGGTYRPFKPKPMGTRAEDD